jgi:hypothetical protein
MSCPLPLSESIIPNPSLSHCPLTIPYVATPDFLHAPCWADVLIYILLYPVIECLDDALVLSTLSYIKLTQKSCSTPIPCFWTHLS